MLKLKCCFAFFFAILINFVKTERVKEIPVTETEDMTNKTDVEKNGNITAREMNSEGEGDEDIHEDYIKILIYQGPEFRTALRYKDITWENAIVPFEISNNFKNEDRNFISEAMEDFHNKTCIRFREKKNETSYIAIIPGKRCSAVIGKRPRGANRVNLHKNCFTKGIIQHELMHTLGFVHEQNRPDRDKFVKIVFDNIKEGAVKNFDKFSLDKVEIFNLTYDYGSIMHYGKYDFAKNATSPTIIPLQDGVEIGQRKGLSERDLEKINLLYECDRKEDFTSATEEATGK